jgi:hypothetical protein
LFINWPLDARLKMQKKIPENVQVKGGFVPRVMTPSPLPIPIMKAGRNHLNEEITPLLLTGMASDIAKPY